MSTNYLDIKDTTLLSNCCGSPTYTDMGICTDCKEHCDVVAEKECPLKGRMGQCKEDECIHAIEDGFSFEQLAIIAKNEKACKEAECDDNGHKCA